MITGNRADNKTGSNKERRPEQRIRKSAVRAAAAVLSVLAAAMLTACGGSQQGPQETTAAASSAVKDGTYRTEVSVKGTELSVQSPATVIIRDGQATAVIVWNGADHDYMKVGGKKLEPVSTEGGSTFRVTVPVFDEPFKVTVSTASSGASEETDCSLTVSSAGLLEDSADIDEEYEADKEASEKTGQQEKE